MLFMAPMIVCYTANHGILQVNSIYIIFCVLVQSASLHHVNVQTVTLEKLNEIVISVDHIIKYIIERKALLNQQLIMIQGLQAVDAFFKLNQLLNRNARLLTLMIFLSQDKESLFLH